MISRNQIYSLLLVSLLAIFIGCSDGKMKPTINAELEGKSIPVQESWNSQIIFSENGFTKAILYSDHLSVFEEENETLLENMKIDFYDETGNVSSVLTSKKGKLDDLTKNMIASDSVVAVSDSGVTLTTDLLEWDNKTQLISTDRFVRIVTDDEIIEGYGFTSDQHIQNYTIYEPTYQAKVKK